jgi:hypothetical protein
MSNSQSVASPRPTAARTIITSDDEVSNNHLIGAGLKFKFTANTTVAEYRVHTY